MAYSMVTQLFPALLASLLPTARITAVGAFTGIVVGETAVAATALGGVSMSTLFPGWSHSITDINAGFLALVLNVLTMVLVSRLSSPKALPARA